MKRLLLKLIPGSIKKKAYNYVRKRFEYTKVTVPYQIQAPVVNRFKDQVAVVTGGSGAIGRAIACRLAAEGALVYVCGTRQEKINSVLNEIRNLGGQAFPYQLDVTSEEKIESFFTYLIEQHGHIDILVNSAGGSARSESRNIFDLATSVIDSILTVNLRGAILCTKMAARHMIKQRRGRIISISSVIGERGKAKFSEYAAAKGGIIAFTKSVAMELGKFGITVNCVSPGIVQRDQVTQEMIDKLATTNYLNSYGKPEDISGAVAYLVSEEASFLTGQNLIVDGGRSLGLKGD